LPQGCIAVFVLNGYYDESARQGARDPISVAGYPFKPTAYKQFCRQWRNVLRAAGGVDFLHMTDLYAGKAQYEQLKDRASVFKMAVDTIDQYATAGVGVAFFQDELEALVPEEWPQRFGSNYSGACQICLQLTANWLDEHRQFASVFYTLENGHTFRNEIDRVLHKAAGTPELKQLFRYHGHTFLDKRDATGLQAADVLAWASTKILSLKAGGQVPASFRSVINVMALDKSKYKVKLLTGKHLIAFLKQLLTQPPHLVDVGPRKRRFR